MVISLKVVFFDLGNTLVVHGAGWIVGAREVLAQLRAKGMRLGLISNTGNMTRAQVLRSLPPDFDLNIFEQGLVILSSEVQVEKPDERIFRLAVTRANLPARACLFCTEVLLDTMVAQQVGMLAARVMEPPASDIETLANKLAAAGFFHA